MIFLAQFSVMDYNIFFFLAIERHVTTEDLEMVFPHEKNTKPAALKPKDFLALYVFIMETN